jgi:hypothetical protein
LVPILFVLMSTFVSDLDWTMAPMTSEAIFPMNLDRLPMRTRVVSECKPVTIRIKELTMAGESTLRQSDINRLSIL